MQIPSNENRNFGLHCKKNSINVPGLVSMVLWVKNEGRERLLMELRIGVIGTGAIGKDHIHRIMNKLKQTISI